MRNTPPNGPRVIVGVDDSPGARWALAWAIGEARLRRLPLHVVHAYERAVPTAMLDAAAMVTHVLKEVAGGLLHDIDVSAGVRPGAPGPVLTALARSTDLLVVGQGTHPTPFLRRRQETVADYCRRRTPATVVSVAVPPLPDTVEPEGFLRRPFPGQVEPGSAE